MSAISFATPFSASLRNSAPASFVAIGEQLTDVETAESTGMALGTVKTHLRRALAILRAEPPSTSVTNSWRSPMSIELEQKLHRVLAELAEDAPVPVAGMRP